MRPVARNLLLEVKDVNQEWTGGILRPESERDGKNNGLVLLDKADNCVYDIPVGAEVFLDYESEDLKQNEMTIDGKRCFVIREDFAMAYMDPNDEAA